MAGPGYECDAVIAPIATGRVDQDLLDKLTATITAGWAHPSRLTRSDGDPGAGALNGQVRELLLANAVALLSGPGQLASLLRTVTVPFDDADD